jgi:hypothetical protein
MNVFKHKIAVISDTHSLLRPEIKERLGECEMILHAGDISSQETADEILECGRTYFVRGNADKYSQAQKDGVCFFNPGSCGPRRFHQEITMAILTVDERDSSFCFEKVDISPILKSDSAKLPEQDMEKLVHNIIKQMDAGKTVEEISRKNRVDTQIVHQILQIYTTHQGIDVQGVLDRMEIAGR